MGKTFRNSIHKIARFIFSIVNISLVISFVLTRIYFYFLNDKLQNEYKNNINTSYNLVLKNINNEIKKIVFYAKNNLSSKKNEIKNILLTHKSFKENIISINLYNVLTKEIIVSTDNKNEGSTLLNKWFNDCPYNQNECEITKDNLIILSSYIKDGLLEKTYGIILTYDKDLNNNLFKNLFDSIIRYFWVLFVVIFVFIYFILLLMRDFLYLLWYKIQNKKSKIFMYKFDRFLSNIFDIFPHNTNKFGIKRWFLHQHFLMIIIEMLLIFSSIIFINFVIYQNAKKYTIISYEEKYKISSKIVLHKINEFEKLGLEISKIPNIDKMFKEYFAENLCITYGNIKTKSEYYFNCNKNSKYLYEIKNIFPPQILKVKM